MSDTFLSLQDNWCNHFEPAPILDLTHPSVLRQHGQSKYRFLKVTVRQRRN